MAKRLGKTTQKQYEELIRFAKKNKILLGGKAKPEDCKNISLLWQNFATYINALGYGPQKTWQQWRQVLVEWKQNTKKKSRKIHLEMTGTGGGANSGIKLTPLEEELLSLLSKIHLGDTEIVDTFQVEMNNAVSPENNTLDYENDHDYITEWSIPHIKETENVENINIIVENVAQDTELRSPKEVKTPMRKVKKLSATKTRNILQEATETYKDAQQMSLQTAQKQYESISKVAEALNNIASVNKAKLKLEYYKTFGSYDNFDNLFS